jgi:thioredoxin-like negative regulator of GroEL
VKVEADLDENADLLEQYKVNSLPTIVLKIGEKVWGTAVGFRTEAELRQWIDVHISVEDEYAKAGANDAS